jgi:diguanylate cyclase (GGDEF)-like protein/PAS domain S-box-containing protein
MRPGRQKWLITLAGICALTLFAQGVWCLYEARQLQTRIDHVYVAAEAQRALTPMLLEGAGVRQLRPLVDRLLQRNDLGLRRLAVYDAEGVLLARAGSFEGLRLPLIPAVLQQRLRDALYALIGSGGQQRLFAPERRLLGSIDYHIDPGSVDGVRVEALAALRLAGWISAVLAIPVALMFVLGMRRLQRTPPPWIDRADPRRQQVADSWGAADLGEFRERAGEVMDALGYGLLVADREGRVRYLNSSAERLTGWSAADAHGRMHYSVVHVSDDDTQPQQGPAERALIQGRAQPTVTGNLRQRHGDSVPVEAIAYPMRNRQGVLDGVTLLFRDTTPHQRELDALRREARLSQAVVDHLDEGLLTTDLAGVVRSANARAERMFGYSRDELVGFTVSKLMPVPFLNTPSIRIADYVAGRGAGKLPKVVGWRKDATTFPVELWVQPMRAEGAESLVVIVRDVSERLRGENLATRLGRLLDSANEEIYIFDAPTLYFLEVNRGARRNLGHSAEQLARMTPLEISEELTEESLRRFLASLRSGEKDHLIYRCRHRRSDGSSYPVEVRLNFSREEEPPVFMAIATDISERLAAEEKLNQLAHFDALTGLPNRVMLYDRLQQALLVAQRGARLLGVYFLDLDRFKQINDTHGHEVGDQVLRAVAERLRAAVRPSDTVARLSGDEFVLLAPGLRTAEDAEFLAQKLLEAFAQPLDLPGLSINQRPSIGVTLYPLDDSDVDGLLRHADHAMYQAKQAGRGCWRLYTLHIDPQRQRQLDLERGLHAAVALNQFQLQMQPAVDSRGEARALLARLRWQHPQYGWIEQTETLQAAGRAGLVADVELWQICEACEYLHAQHGNAPPAILAVSGWQLRDREFVGHLLQLLDRYRVPGAALVLALTPDGLAEAVDRHPDSQRLIERGLRFALRDFNHMPTQPPLPLSYVLAGPAQFDAPMPAGVSVIAVGVDDAATLERAKAAGIGLVLGSAVAASVSRA